MSRRRFGTILNPGEEIFSGSTSPFAGRSVPQVVYLDFDGGLNRYNGELFTVGQVQTGASGLDAGRIAAIAAELNALFAERNVRFVTKKPDSGEYSTVFVGKTDAFSGLGDIRGIAESVDSGNRNRSDNAFVLMDAESSDQTLIELIAHETGHLLGDSHEGEGIEAYLADGILTVAAGEHCQHIQLSSSVLPYRYLELYGTASNTAILGGGVETVHSGGFASRCGINSDGNQNILSGGRADSSIVVFGGTQSIFDGGVADSAMLVRGTQVVRDGGVTNSTTVSEYGIEIVSSGGTANQTLLLESGTLMVHAGGSALKVEQSSGGTIGVAFGTGDSTYIAGTHNGSDSFLLANDVASGFYIYRRAAFIEHQMLIRSGGTAIDTRVIGGLQEVLKDGLAIGTEISDYGAQNISGGTAISTTVTEYGGQYVSSGGTADFTEVKTLGGQFVYSAGTANSTFLNIGCSQIVFYKGIANSTHVSGGLQYVSFGGVANDTYIEDFGVQFVSSGGTAIDTIIDSGHLRIEGGTAHRIRANNGYIDICSGGILNSAMISTGTIYASRGAILTGDILLTGSMFLYESGVDASNADIVLDFSDWDTRNAASIVYISRFSGSVNLTVSVDSSQLGGYSLATDAANFLSAIRLKVDGAITGISLVAGGAARNYGDNTYRLVLTSGHLSLLITQGTKEPSMIVTCADGDLIDPDGGGISFTEAMTAYAVNYGTIGFAPSLNGSAILFSGELEQAVQSLTISGNGADRTIIRAVGGGFLAIGGSGTQTQILRAATLEGAVIDNGGWQHVSSGGVVNSAVINRYGYQYISSGGAANDAVVNSGGFQCIYSSGMANFSEISNGGSQRASYRGTANETVVFSGGEQHLESSGTANFTTVSHGGTQVVSSGGRANDTTVCSGGTQSVNRSGSVNSTVINSGGLLEASAGAVFSGAIILAGSMTLAGTATAAAAAVTFELADRSTGDGVIVNNITYLNSAASFTVSVGAAQTGTYRLAGGAGSFGTRAITLNVDGRSVTSSLTPGSIFTYAGYEYLLNLSGTTLQLTVSVDDHCTVPVADETLYLGDSASPASGDNVYGRLTASNTYACNIYGGGRTNAVAGEIRIDVESDARISAYLFAGGNTADAGSTELNVFSGATLTSYLFGGGRNADVTGGAVVNGKGVIHNLVGGGLLTLAGGEAGVGSVTINLSEGFAGLTTNSVVIGGGQTTAAGSATVSSVAINLDGGAPAMLYGGGYATAGTASVGTVTIAVSDANFTSYLYGGGRAAGSGSLASVETVTISLDGGTFNHVFGGGYAASGGTATVDAVDILITGGFFNGTVYGGGHAGGGTATVGDVSITIDVSAENVVNFRTGSGITLGGNSASAVTGNTLLTLTGRGSNLRTADGGVTGWLNASDCGADSSKTHTLTFADFTDMDFRARIRGFNHLAFSGGSCVTLAVGIGYQAGMNYTFDLTGRDISLAGTAFLKQEAGNLGITADSEFRIHLTSADLFDDSGSFLLLDGIDGVDWNFRNGSMQLTFDEDVAYGKFGGEAILLGDYCFNLEYSQTDGHFLLSWSRDEPENGIFSLSAGSNIGQLA